LTAPVPAAVRQRLDRVRAVTLDAGGVLLMPAVDAVHQALAPYRLCPGAGAVDRAHFRAVAAVDAEPEPRWETYLAGHVGAYGITGPRLAEAMTRFDETVTPDRWTRVPDGTGSALRALAARDLRLGSIANSTGVIAGLRAGARVCQVGPGPGAPVGVVLDSGEYGADKPDPAIFHAALEALGVTAGQTLHVGDTVHADVRGAVAAGLTAVHLDPLGACRDCPAHLHIAALSGLDRLLPARSGALASTGGTTT